MQADGGLDKMYAEAVNDMQDDWCKKGRVSKGRNWWSQLAESSVQAHRSQDVMVVRDVMDTGEMTMKGRVNKEC